MMRRPRKFVEIHIDKVVQITADHGGYQAGNCLSCGASGWLDGKYGYHSKAGAWDTFLVHKPGCPMNRHAERVWTRGK